MDGDGKQAQDFRGGFGQGMRYAQWPTMRLRRTLEGMTLGPSRHPWAMLFRAALPQWQFAWSQVQRAERVVSVVPLFPAIRFTTTTQRSFLFYTPRIGELFRGLRQHGVPADERWRMAPWLGVIAR